LSAIAVDRTPDELIAHAADVIGREAEAVHRLAADLDERLGDVVSALLHCQGHVLVTGAGTSRAIAERLAHLLSCCGTPALFLSASDGLHGGAGAITARDVVYVISKGGQSADINKLVEIAHARGAMVIAQTEKPDSPLGKMSDLVLRLHDIGREDPFGYIATSSSLVNAAMGDVLCVLLLEARGYTLEAVGQTPPEGAVGRSLETERPKL